MAIHNQNQVTPDIRALQQQMARVSDELFGGNGVLDQLDRYGQSIQSLLIDRVNTPASPVGNLLWNGELGHSNFSWHGDIGDVAVGQENEECAWWYSHLTASSSFTFVSGDVNTTNDTIFETDHGLTTGQAVVLSTTGTLPAPLTPGTYYVIWINSSSFRLATTLADAEAGAPYVNLTDGGSGTHTVSVGQLSGTTSPASSSNNTLKTTVHSTYNVERSRWDAVNGWAELMKTTSVDALLPTNFVDATTPLARVGMIAAKRNRYIDLPNTCLMAAGIWDNTAGQAQFVAGSISFVAELSGTAGSTERRYKLLITSDRGFTLLSPEVVISNAPSDAQFSATRNIVMSWPQQAGQLQAEIYEYIPSLAQYRLIAQISGATSYIHLGSYLSFESGYPLASASLLSATYFTLTGEMRRLATNGVSAAWDTVIFPISVPANYDKSLTTDRQWLRIWVTVAPDLLVTGCTTNGTTTITAPSASSELPTAFAAEYASLFPGLTAYVYDENDNLLQGTTVNSRTDDDNIVLNAGIAAGSNRKLRIVGGGFHGVYIDKIHLGYQHNTSYSHNANDMRRLQPRAAPTSSTQGGVGEGDGGYPIGGIRCIAMGTPVKMDLGIWKPVQSTRPGQTWASPGLKPNILLKLTEGVCRVRRVRAANGCEIVCTDTERFVVDRHDVKGTPLARLRVGDTVLTDVDDRIEASTIIEISPYEGLTQVYTPTLSNNHLFIAGKVRLSWWNRLRGWIIRRRAVEGGFVLHNAKEYDPLVV